MQADAANTRAESSSTSGGGGPTYNAMEARVSALEKKFDRIETKLDSVVADTSYIKGPLEGMSNSAAFGELKGRVDSLPTTAKVASLLGIAVAVVTIVTKWAEISAALKATAG